MINIKTARPLDIANRRSCCTPTRRSNEAVRPFRLLAGAATSARPLRAQQKAMPVARFLLWKDRVNGFQHLDGSSAMGHVEGQNVAREYHNAEGHYYWLPAFAAELVQRNVSAIATFSLPAVRAAKAATTTIPIIFIMPADSVTAGLVVKFQQDRCKPTKHELNE